MLEFLTPKSKIQAYGIREVPIETFEIIGIGQINPYCDSQYDNEKFLTVVNIGNETRSYDEKEGLLLASHFALKKCPKCKKQFLTPVRIRINLDSVYLQHEEEIAFDAYEEHPLKRHFPSTVEAFCTHCSACFEIRIKSKDSWVKDAKKIKHKELIIGWDEYFLD